MLGRLAGPSFHDMVVPFEGKTFTGRAVLGKSWLKANNPIILVLPDVMGCKAFDMYRCLHLSRILGCAAVAVDLYGDAFPRQKREDRGNVGEAFDHMNALLVDPLYLRRLLRAYIEESVKQLNGDPKRVGAIGFCFGGACVLEMVRDGAPLAVAVTMHATLESKPLASLDGRPPPPVKTSAPPPKHTPGAHLMVCTGAVDPFIPPPVLTAFLQEMDKAQFASFTVASYGKVTHAFTAPTQEAPNAFIAFNANAARRAWVAAFDLFAQVFNVRMEGEISSEFWTDTLVLPRL